MADTPAPTTPPTAETPAGQAPATDTTSDKPPFKPPRRAPPPGHQALLQVVNRYAEHYEVAAARVQRWISYMMLGAVLDRIPPEDQRPVFLHKGGVSLEMRLKLGARATKDFDTTFRLGRERLLETLDTAFSEPYEGFRFRRTGEPTFETTRMVRVDIKVEYHGKSWNTIPLEVSAADPLDPEPEYVPAFNLAELGLRGPAVLPCIPLAVQTAHKIHGVSEVLPAPDVNERVNDLVDLVALRAVLPASPTLRAACEATFAARNSTPWPPVVTPYQHWAAPYRAAAEQLGLDITDAADAAATVNRYIAEIAAAE